MAAGSLSVGGVWSVPGPAGHPNTLAAVPGEPATSGLPAALKTAEFPLEKGSDHVPIQNDTAALLPGDFPNSVALLAQKQMAFEKSMPETRALEGLRRTGDDSRTPKGAGRKAAVHSGVLQVTERLGVANSLKLHRMGQLVGRPKAADSLHAESVQHAVVPHKGGLPTPLAPAVPARKRNHPQMIVPHLRTRIPGIATYPLHYLAPQAHSPNPRSRQARGCCFHQHQTGTPGAAKYSGQEPSRQSGAQVSRTSDAEQEEVNLPLSQPFLILTGPKHPPLGQAVMIDRRWDLQLLLFGSAWCY